MTKITPPEIWKRYNVRLYSSAGYHNTKINEFKCQSLDIDENQTAIRYHGFGAITNDCEVMPPFVYSGPQTQHGALHQLLGGGRIARVKDSGCWKILHLAIGLCALPHEQNDPVLAVRIFLWHSRLQSPWRVGWSERPTEFCATRTMNHSLYHFKQGDRRKDLLGIPEFSRGRGWIQLWYFK